MTQFDQRHQQVDTQYNAEYITIQQQPISLTEKQRKQNRTRMLDRVQAIWIDGVLEPSVQGAAQIALELENKPSAVVTPLWSVLREFDKTGPLSSADASIMQVYDHATGEVLILGEPGAGKTTLLLELTRDLLERAHQDETFPIPVVFNLSSWGTSRQTFADWLIGELHTKYQIPRPLAISWITTDQVLPLLDGLDEVVAGSRGACVESINMYRRAHGLLPTVVCCRQADYLVLSTRLLLRTAVVVLPLTSQQIEFYLASRGKQLEPLRQTLRDDAELQVLASTPLMLNVLTIAYQGIPHEKITSSDSPDILLKKVFASYVQRMLTRRSTGSPYTPEQTTHWLTHLAQQMKQQRHTIFSIEYMQPDWLPKERSLRVYEWLGVRIPGCLMGVLVSIPIFLLFDLLSGSNPVSLFVGISLGLVGGWLGILWSGDTISQSSAEEIARSEKHSRLSVTIRSILVNGLLMGAGIGLIFGLGAEKLNLGDRLHAGLSIGAISGFGCFLLGEILAREKTAQASVSGAPRSETSTWYAFLVNKHIARGGLVGIILGSSIGIPLQLLRTPQVHGSISALLISVLGAWLICGLLYGAEAALLSVILVGKNSVIQPVEQLVWSWSSLWQSLTSTRHLRDWVLIALISGLITGLVFGLTAGLVFGLTFGLSYWLLFGLLQGVKGQTLDEQIHIIPNQGIYRSAHNGLLFGCIGGCISVFTLSLGIGLFWILYTLIFIWPGLVRNSVPVLSTLQQDLDIILHYGPFIGLACGLLLGLLNGWLACLRHGVLRWLLWRRESIPWNYPRFLDNAYEQILLRKVGGGYIFLHQLLLDYFADLETGSDSIY